ncbi:hypothetical protein FB45DRAFT_998989 [Roridomyces roridus]|uniref:Uncharacterized protein n=1 Tax=Roridomyces roridus TaxID=1738132 RepID=A0AAD7FU25_9AGAR|nr:hypothetical protein FB45DRAFT_998989 [Roridomyces roridus]
MGISITDPLIPTPGLSTEPRTSMIYITEILDFSISHGIVAKSAPAAYLMLGSSVAESWWNGWEEHLNIRLIEGSDAFAVTRRSGESEAGQPKGSSATQQSASDAPDAGHPNGARRTRLIVLLLDANNKLVARIIVQQTRFRSNLARVLVWELNISEFPSSKLEIVSRAPKNTVGTLGDQPAEPTLVHLDQQGIYRSVIRWLMVLKVSTDHFCSSSKLIIEFLGGWLHVQQWSMAEKPVGSINP